MDRSAPTNTTGGAAPQAPSDAQMARSNLLAQKQRMAVAGEADSSQVSMQTLVPQSKSQLIKTATLTLRVPEVEPILRKATQVVGQRGGDILSLQDQVPPTDTIRHTASLKFRVPQQQLDFTLEDLAKLGVVETRSIQAEDVATQIVDFESRLKNLRKTEGVVVGIMDRSGSIGDVLKVSQELSNIRNEIEQIQGQVQHLKQQVAFSVINLTVKEAVAQNQQGIPFGERLQESWTQSTHALGETTADLMELAVWVLVFSPYVVGTVALVFLIRALLVRRSSTASSAPSEQSNP
jgi:ACT domain-containing protein